ncbi:hypothetical protein PG996_006423 [Apiospora saccharicola]|uniref:DUF6536 domain-containing protein n=1 Tax=Apiospora saccharicola TaxID=335842 RepID=A0ABR1VPA1_9PEZI
MKLAHPFFRRGWRRLGVFNIILASLCGLSIFTAFSTAFIHREGTSTFGSTTIDEGRCDDTSRTSIILHVLVNIVSTGVLASSNFFMQIVTSPTRKEIDQAHMFLQPLNIGLPSWRNLSSLPHFKKACWLLLLSSSIPIHLFFNSAIYKTAYRGDHYNLVIATAAFTQNEKYWLPGASLAPSGASSPVQTFFDISGHNDTDLFQRLPGDPRRDIYINPGHNQSKSGGAISGYGEPFPLGAYWNKSSPIRQTIENIAHQASTWDKLSFEQCIDEYRTNNPLSKHSDLLIIVSSGTNISKGWQRDQVYEFDPRTNLSEIWDPHVPPEAINPLWYWTSCVLQFKVRVNSCGRIIGSRDDGFYSPPPPINTSRQIRFKDDGYHINTTDAEESRGYKAIREELDIEHCLAKPVKCRVLVSSGLLLVVLSCVLVKVATCITILWYQQDASLITPGDAIESFISKPDTYTRGLASLNVTDSQNLQCLTRKETVCPIAHDGSFIKPRRWQETPQRLRSVITKRVWIQVYYIASVVLVGVVGALVVALQRYVAGDGDIKSFGPSDNVSIVDFLSGMGYYATLIVVNTPQLILSFIYLVVNMLHTQLQLEREWNSYALAYTPLRVSFPHGEQTSTYRLQLPYKYSIPLISTSAALHWMISNCLFIVIVDGTLDGTDMTPVERNPNRPETTNDRLREDFNMSGSVYITAGYSVTAIFVLFVSGTLFVLSPLFFSSQKLKGNMTFGATNSLVLSAACHVPRATSHIRSEPLPPVVDTSTMKGNKTRDMLVPASTTDGISRRNGGYSPAVSSVAEYDDIEYDGSSDMRSLLVDSEHERAELTQTGVDEEYLIALSRMPLRWGVTSLPDDLKRELSTENDDLVMHLSFGGEEHDVREPQINSLYA